MPAQLKLSRAEVLAFRRSVGSLDERLPARASSLERAASAGLTDSMPRAALLGLHARVDGVAHDTWDDAALVQVWGPRYSVYVVPVGDLAIFTLGRLPDTGKTRARAEELAARLHMLLEGAPSLDVDVAAALGVKSWELKYAALTGTIAIRWEGARAPTLWTVAPPTIGAAEATQELARRYLHVLGPSTPDGFAGWSGVGEPKASRTFAELELVAVRTPLGDAHALAIDEPALREPKPPSTGVRLLPSGDAYTLGVTLAERTFLVPDDAERGELWTPRVWPGALLVDGQIAGTWRRAKRKLTVQAWRRFTPAEREAIVAEAESFPLPDPGTGMAVEWSGL